MNRIATKVCALALLSAAGCMNLTPHLPATDASIPQQWPLPATTPSAPAAEATKTIAAADIGWRDFFVDPAVRELIARALENNRDLRVVAIDIERARALYRIQRADQFPSVGLGASATRSGGSRGSSVAPESYIVNLGLAEYELDFFGRVRSLSQVALQQYFEREENRRAAQLSLIAEVANAYLTLAADQALLEVARATFTNHSESFALTQQRHRLGAVSALDLSQARTSVEQARADAARFTGQVARDTNALTLLVGAVVEPALLPTTLAAESIGIADLPAGLPSEVLLRRPDVLQAEHLLRAANANIGAARAAYFPSISLTAAIGTASTALSGLFGSGSGFWTFSPRLDLPIFDPGRLQGNLEAARAEQSIALAQYEKAVQAGFRDVADALALTRTLAEQREAQQALLEAAARANELSLARYRAGRDSFLVQLDSQRTLYAAEQALISTRLAEQTNRVTLYKVLGGGWRERSE